MILFRFFCLCVLVLAMMAIGVASYELAKICVSPFVADPLDQSFAAMVLSNALIITGLLLYLKDRSWS